MTAPRPKGRGIINQLNIVVGLLLAEQQTTEILCCSAISIYLDSAPRETNWRGAWQVSVSELAYKEGAAANTGALLTPRTFLVITISLQRRLAPLQLRVLFAAHYN
jgi:hypothetical protein